MFVYFFVRRFVAVAEAKIRLTDVNDSGHAIFKTLSKPQGLTISGFENAKNSSRIFRL